MNRYDVLHIGQRAEADVTPPLRQQGLDVAARHLQRADQIHAQRRQPRSKCTPLRFNRHLSAADLTAAGAAQRVDSVLGRADHLRRDLRDLMPHGVVIFSRERCLTVLAVAGLDRDDLIGRVDQQSHVGLGDLELLRLRWPFRGLVGGRLHRRAIARRRKV